MGSPTARTTRSAGGPRTRSRRRRTSTGFAASGSCGLIYGVGPGRAPSSEIAHWAMLGYTPEEFPGRAVFEALGDGQELDAGQVFAFAALRPAERRPDGLWLTGRPRRERRGRGRCRGARRRVRRARDRRFPVRADAPAPRRVACCGSSRAPTTGSPTRTPSSATAIPCCGPRPRCPRPSATARAAEAWTRQTIEILAAHPVNERRAEQGLPALNVITLKWWGRPRSAPTFPQRHGLHGSFLGDSRFLLGLARAVGLEPRVRARDGRLRRPICARASTSPSSASPRATRSSSRT